jgi:hypothetical protein
VLYVSTAGALLERGRVDWDTTESEPDRVRIGIGRSPAGRRASILVDDIRLTEAVGLAPL